MTKCASLLFYATIVCSFYGSLAESPGSQTKLENIEGQLQVLRIGQNNTQRQLEALLQKLTGIEIFLEKMALSKTSSFEQIGSRLFYIESEKYETWYNAANTCIRMGGHLAGIQSDEELSQITEKLQKGNSYWLDINDLVNEGEYMSATTSRRATFLKWRPNQPKDLYGNRDCVFLANGFMEDYGCNFKWNFICEADMN